MSDEQGQVLSTAEIGQLGEAIAQSWLRSRKIKVLYRNFRAPGGGEVDIVARDGEVLLFIEVKTRTSERLGRPLSAVNNKKRKLIRRGGREWLKLIGNERDMSWRYDVIEIVLKDGELPKLHQVQGIAAKRPRDNEI